MRKPRLTGKVMRGLAHLSLIAREVAYDYRSDYNDHRSRSLSQVEEVEAAAAYISALAEWDRRRRVTDERRGDG